MPQIKTAIGPIWYAHHRKPDAPTMILIHGAGSSHLDWSAQLRQMDGVSVLVPDLPGHGKTGGDGYASVDEYANAILAFMEALDLSSVILCGHSMGGAIAQTVTLNNPQLISGLILIGTGARLPVNKSIINGILEKKEDTLQLMVKWMWAQSTDEQILQGSYERQMEVSADVIHGDLVACNAFDTREYLTEITVPTLIIGGTEDKMTPFKFSQTLAEGISDSELVVIENGGHMMALEQPQHVADVVKNWLQRHK